MSVPVGNIIFTGALATRSSSTARYLARACSAASSSVHVSAVPSLSERKTPSTTRES